MVEDLDAILKRVEILMGNAKTEYDRIRDGTSFDLRQLRYSVATYYGIQALYEQNRVIIELLKERKE